MALLQVDPKSQHRAQAELAFHKAEQDGLVSKAKDGKSVLSLFQDIQNGNVSTQDVGFLQGLLKTVQPKDRETLVELLKQVVAMAHDATPPDPGQQGASKEKDSDNKAAQNKANAEDQRQIALEKYEQFKAKVRQLEALLKGAVWGA